MSGWGRTLVVGLLLALSSSAGVSPPARAQVVNPLDGPPLCGTAEGEGTPGADDGTLRVATFNILHSLDDDADATIDQRIELVADALAASGADAAGLQEVVASTNHGVVAERVAQGLAARTGDTWHWCFNRSNPHVPGEPDTEAGGAGGPLSAFAATQARAGDSPWTEGLAVVSRYEIVDQQAHRLPPRTAEVPFCVAENPDDPFAGPTCALDTRQVLWTRLGTPCGALDFFTTHLAHHLSSQTELSQQLQITDALATIDTWAADDPASDVYVGDFNTEEGSAVHRAVLDAGFVDTFRVAEPGALGATSDQDILAPEATVSRRIDFVFARPGTATLTPSDAGVIGDDPAPRSDGAPGEVVWPSDHFGVAVSLTAPGGCAPAPVATGVPGSTVRTAGSGGAGGAELPATGTSMSLAVPLALLLLGASGLVVAVRRR